MDDFDDALANRSNKNNFKKSKHNKIIDLKQLGGQTSIDQLLQKGDSGVGSNVINLGDIMSGT